MAEQGSFWETLIGGTGEGPEEERKEKPHLPQRQRHDDDSEHDDTGQERAAGRFPHWAFLPVARDKSPLARPDR